MHLFTLFFLIQVLSISLSQDAQVKDDTKMIMISTNNNHDDDNDQIIIKSKDNPHQPTQPAHTEMAQPSIEKVKEKRNRTIELFEYVDHIKAQGKSTLKYIGKEIMKEMETNIVENINTGIKNYFKKIHNYLYFIVTTNGELIFDEDFVLVDTSDIACRLLFHEQKKILDNIVAKKLSNNNEVDYSASVAFTEIRTTRKLLEDSFKNVSNTIYRHNTVLRKDEIQYICNKYKVCRTYPAFSDYFGYFLSDILRLPDSKFEIFANLLGTIVKLNHHLLEVAYAIRHQDIFIIEMDKLCGNITKMKESLEILRDILTQKFDIICNTNLKFKNRAPAVRKLLDIINNSFKDGYHEQLVLEYDAMITAVRSWAKGNTPAIADDILQFINEIFHMLHLIIQSDKSGRKEILTLIQTIYEGDAPSKVGLIL